MFGAIAAATAAFAGLLFIALTVNLPRILPDAARVARAREALGGLLSLLVVAILILIPRQSRVALGIEMVSLAVVIVAISGYLEGQTIRHLPSERRTRWALRTLPYNVGTATVLVSGISMIAAVGGGLYWLIATVLIYFLWSARNVWVLVVEPAETSRRD